MSPQISWVALILALPGIALLVVSTATRYGQIHDEIHSLLHTNDHHPSTTVMHHLARRAQLFRDALVALYFTIAIFGLGAVLGAITAELMPGSSYWVVVSFACVGMGGLIYASLCLMREAMLSLEIIHEHLEHVEIEST
jgi:hypothetical protein